MILPSLSLISLVPSGKIVSASLAQLICSNDASLQRTLVKGEFSMCHFPGSENGLS